MELDMRLISN